MSNLNISTRRTTLNKLSAEPPTLNSSFRPPKSPNFSQVSTTSQTSQDGDFVVPKPTKKIKTTKNGESVKALVPSQATEEQPKSGWAISNISNSAQLDELLKKQEPSFLENIQMKVPDENWQREALKQIENSSLKKLFQNGLSGFNTEGTFSGPMEASFQSLKPDEIAQLIDKFNDNVKQKIDYFPNIQEKFSQTQGQGLPVIPDIPLELQNALDDFVYRPDSFKMSEPSNGQLLEKFFGNQNHTSISIESNKSDNQKTSGFTQTETKSKSQHEKEATDHKVDQNSMAINQLKPQPETPQQATQTSSYSLRATRSTRKLASGNQENPPKPKAEKTASDDTKNFPPKELLRKRSLPKNTEDESQISPQHAQKPGDNQQLPRRATKRSPKQQSPPHEAQQQLPSPSPKNSNRKSKITTAVGSPDSSQSSPNAKRKSPKSKEKTSNSDDDSLEMPFATFIKEKEANDNAMEIEEQTTGIQRIVNLKIGKSHQTVPLALVLNKERPRRQIKKMVWSPKCIDEKAFENYFEQLKNIIEKDITNEEVACRTLLKFDTDVNKAIDSIKKNVAYYKNQMIPGQRVLRNRSSLLS